MRASDYIAEYLEKRGVSHVFELVGGMITFLVDSLQQRGAVKIVSMHHEQAAGFAAEGFARIGGIPGIAMATSGPGATNLLTAIGSCYFDSVPAVFITGQVNRHELKGTRKIRQLGFQETDIVSMAAPITKASWLVKDVAELPVLLEEAFRIAVSGRCGPVLVDIPMDVQRADVVDLSRLSSKSCDDVTVAAPRVGSFVQRLHCALECAQRPLVLAGGGISSARCTAQFREYITAIKVPVVNSLMGVDALPYEHPQRVGLIGSYGNRWANIAISEADILVVLGSRLDIRQTGADTVSFKGDRKIFHVDCDAGELNNRLHGCDVLECALGDFLTAGISQVVAVNRPDWVSHISELKEQWPDDRELRVHGINPNRLMHELSHAGGQAVAYVADVGQHQMWAAQSLRLRSDQRFLTSGGMGAMGFALPAAIGACFSAGVAPVVVVAGDGGFQLNLQELETVARNRLPLKIVVVNNGCHGMVRQFQESYFKQRYQSTVWGYSAPNIAAVAAAYGLRSMRVDKPELLRGAISAMWAEPGSPFLLEVGISMEANAYPKMAFGKPISEMEPLAKPLDMEGT